jgi:hypothetical protein
MNGFGGCGIHHGWNADVAENGSGAGVRLRKVPDMSDESSEFGSLTAAPHPEEMKGTVEF